MSELYEGKTPEDPRREIGAVRERLASRWGDYSWLAFASILNDLEQIRTVRSLSRTR